MTLGSDLYVSLLVDNSDDKMVKLASTMLLQLKVTPQVGCMNIT